MTVEDMEEGFDICRERGYPVQFYVVNLDEVWKFFPSGHAKKIRDGW